MDRDTTKKRMRLATEVLLPGHYDCLTTQLNITTYRAGEQARFVCVTRMPTDQVEVKRDFQDIGEFGHVQSSAIAALRQHILEMNYLMLNGKGT